MRDHTEKHKSREKRGDSMTKVKPSTGYLTRDTVLHPLSHWGDPIIVKGCFKESSQQGRDAAVGEPWQKKSNTPAV